MDSEDDSNDSKIYISFINDLNESLFSQTQKMIRYNVHDKKKKKEQIHTSSKIERAISIFNFIQEIALEKLHRTFSNRDVSISRVLKTFDRRELENASKGEREYFIRDWRALNAFHGNFFRFLTLCARVKGAPPFFPALLIVRFSLTGTNGTSFPYFPVAGGSRDGWPFLAALGSAFGAFPRGN